MIGVLSRVLADQTDLPPNLVIQLDNTSQDNKNQMLFTYLATLVETKQFDSVTVNFLPVGHTHVSDRTLSLEVYHHCHNLNLCI